MTDEVINSEIETSLLYEAPDYHEKCFSTYLNEPIFYPNTNLKRPVFKKLVKFTDPDICSYLKNKRINFIEDKELFENLNSNITDPADVSLIDFNHPSRQSYHQKHFYKCQKGNNSYPLNPVGITGFRGRGSLLKWGVNYKIELIFTRFKKTSHGSISLNEKNSKKCLEMVVLEKDNSFTLPGGFCQFGRSFDDQLQNIFRDMILESLLYEPDRKAYEIVKENIKKKYFENNVLIYRGYIDDPRNTDNAWVESSIYLIHDENNFMNGFNFNADSVLKWVTISSSLDTYANHRSQLKKACKILNASFC